jgi:hypothetical protein
VDGYGRSRRQRVLCREGTVSSGAFRIGRRDDRGSGAANECNYRPSPPGGGVPVIRQTELVKTEYDTWNRDASLLAEIGRGGTALDAADDHGLLIDVASG